MKQLTFLILVLVIGLSSYAQESAKIRFGSINYAAWLKGETRSKVQAQSINGVRYKSFFAGIGVGIDNYYFKTIPVFADLRKNMFNRKATPFVYADLGASFIQDRIQNETQWYKDVYHTGLYYDLGLGYTAPLTRKLFFSFAMGYSLKKTPMEKIYSVLRDFPPYGAGETSREKYDYSFRRLSIKAGLSF